MNKKQLNLQNASLFAELERKAKEIEILNIKLEEAEKKSEVLKNDIASLKESLNNSISAGKALSEENEELKAKVEELSRINEELKNEAPTLPQVILPEVTENAEAEAAEEDFEDELITETLVPPFTKEEEQYVRLLNEEAKRSAPINDILRDYGAHIIGKVTRATAETLSKITATGSDAAESLKTLALGKNESLKFQIMELAGCNRDPEAIKKEMNALADEAIIYLKSIIC